MSTRQNRSSNQRRAVLATLAAIAVVLIIGVGARTFLGGDRTSDGAVIGGPFTMVDSDGRTVTDADFRGRYMLVFFGYTYCPDVCPTMLALVTSALDQLPERQRAKVVPIFVSVDPGRDTPEVMKDYVGSFSPEMVGLTGSSQQVTAMLKAYKVYAAKVPSGPDGSYTMDHSAILYLMGPDGRFVSHFTATTTVDQLVEGLRKHVS